MPFKNIMILLDILYFIVLVMGIVSAAILRIKFRKANQRLPESWRSTSSLKKMQLGVFLLLIHLGLNCFFECIALCMKYHTICNEYIANINCTLTIPLLLGFFWVNTSTTWKRISYIVMYTILLIHMITSDAYLPDCINNSTTGFIIGTVYFMAALLYLSNLLLNQKAEHFHFQLKIAITVLVFNLIMNILSVYIWNQSSINTTFLELISYVYHLFVDTFYIVLAIIFITETRKLRRG